MSPLKGIERASDSQIHLARQRSKPYTGGGAETEISQVADQVFESLNKGVLGMIVVFEGPTANHEAYDAANNLRGDLKHRGIQHPIVVIDSSEYQQSQTCSVIITTRQPDTTSSPTRQGRTLFERVIGLLPTTRH